MSQLINLETIKKVQIGDDLYNIEGAVESLDELKTKVVEIDPTLANAEMYVEDDVLKFARRAGTKGLF